MGKRDKLLNMLVQHVSPEETRRANITSAMILPTPRNVTRFWNDPVLSLIVGPTAALAEMGDRSVVPTQLLCRIYSTNSRTKRSHGERHLGFCVWVELTHTA